MEQFSDLQPDVDVLSAIKQLPDDLAAILSMRFVGGLDTRSVAGIMQTSTATIKRKQAVAVSHLKKILRK
jgi:DNA-directed RNA polymerase specialized sigma24 family protein